MNECKISIIIPTYNRAWCIENAIKSVISQNYQNRELFVIDDGSNDNTKEILKKYINEKVKYFYKENSGKLPSVNFGIDNLISKESDLLFILDSDDEFLPGIFQDVNNEFTINNSFVSYHYKAKFPKFIKNRYSELVEKDKDFIIVDYEKLLSGKSHKGDFHGFINIHTLLDIRFEVKSPNGMENIFWLRLNSKGISKYINKPGLFMESSRKEGQEKDNLTSYFSIFKRASSMISGYNILINENKTQVLEIDKNILSIWYFEQFQWCIIDRKLELGFNSWINSIKYGNIKIKMKNFIFGFLFIMPKKFLPIILKFYYKTR